MSHPAKAAYTVESLGWYLVDTIEDLHKFYRVMVMDPDCIGDSVIFIMRGSRGFDKEFEDASIRFLLYSTTFTVIKEAMEDDDLTPADPGSFTVLMMAPEDVAMVITIAIPASVMTS
jgi:hypothetical protein